jgi:chlorite dismutase
MPDCDQILNNKHLWAFNETEELERDKFDAKKEFKKSLEKRTNEENNGNEETYVYSILRSKLNAI